MQCKIYMVVTSFHIRGHACLGGPKSEAVLSYNSYRVTDSFNIEEEGPDWTQPNPVDSSADEANIYTISMAKWRKMASPVGLA